MRWIILLGLLLCGGRALSHPHSFIEMELTPVVGNQAISGLHMVWTMDEMTSADLLYDAKSAGADSEIWKKLAAEVMANVLSQGYFTEIQRGDQVVEVQARPSEYHLTRVGHKAVLSFVLPLAQPQPLQGEPLTIATYEPSYFVDFSYQDAQKLHLPVALQGQCRLALFTPQPDDTLRAYALALDKEDTPDEDQELGKQFAQRVTLQCH